MKRIIGLGILAVGLVVGLSSPPAVAAQGEFAGTWTSIDPGDGSDQTLIIAGSGTRAYAISLFDNSATLCSGAPALVQGSVRLEESSLSGHAVAVCLPGGNQLHHVIDIVFTPTADDTLTDNFGAVWSRE